MKHQLQSVWDDYVQPMFKRPDRIQFAALCYDVEGPDKKVLLITSRGTGRWVLPKGWPIEGLNSPQSALQEAWEEAGVRRGRTGTDPVGSYGYDKGLPGDWSVPVTTMVYPVLVEEMRDDFPEADERRREWVTPEEASRMVDEPELQKILASFSGAASPTD